MRLLLLGAWWGLIAVIGTRLLATLSQLALSVVGIATLGLGGQGVSLPGMRGLTITLPALLGVVSVIGVTVLLQSALLGSIAWWAREIRPKTMLVASALACLALLATPWLAMGAGMAPTLALAHSGGTSSLVSYSMTNATASLLQSLSGPIPLCTGVIALALRSQGSQPEESIA